MTMRHRHKSLRLLLCVAITMIFGVGFEQPTVRIELTDSVGPRRLETQTQAAIIRDYLAAWKTLSAALQQNRADLLDAAFVGIAKEKLTETVQAQRHLGIRTVYQDRSHDLKLLFYSPEGLSVQLSDTVEYDVRVMDHDKLQGTRRVQARYLAVLTPSEVQWKVRIFQAAPSN